MTDGDPVLDDPATPDTSDGPEGSVRVEGGARTAIGVARGATHAGQGDLNQNFFYEVSRERRRRSPSSYDERNEEQIAHVFVAPSGYDRALDVLRTSQVVLVHGTPGSGRKLAALRLLSEQRTGDSGPIRILEGGEDPADRELLVEHVTEAGLLLLDLSDAAGRSGLDRLAGLMNEVRLRNAFVVVVLHGPPDASIPDVLRRDVSEIGRPAGNDVFLKHLRHEGVPGDEPSAWRDDLRDYITGSAMADIRELALLTREEHEAEPDVGFTGWTGRALARVTSRHVAIARGLDIPSDIGHRTLAFAAAVFAGCPADVVVEAERRLADAVGAPEPDAHELASPDLGTRLGRVRARLRDDLVEFDGFGHAAAVRTYFWTQFPGLRDGFHQWFVDGSVLAQECGLPVADYVGRYTDLALRTGQPGLIGVAVERWAQRGRDLAFAGVALVQGVHDVRFSAWFRSRCYRWAISRTLPSDLARVVVLVCATTIAPSWPEQAVVRLHHLTAHADADVRAAARDGLVTVLGDDAALRFLLSRLVARSSDADPADSRIFLAVVDPHRLLSVQHPPIGDLTTCWTTALTALPAAEYEPGIHRWLAADAASDGGSWLPGVVARAAAAAGRSAAVHAATHRWFGASAPTPQGPGSLRHKPRRAAARRMLDELDTTRRAQMSARVTTYEGPR